MPRNVSRVQEITAHEVRFRLHQPPMEWGYQQLPPVDGHCREITLGRKEGVQPLANYVFEVRAISADSPGPWTSITKYFCKLLP